jgi:hypothetical protein
MVVKYGYSGTGVTETMRLTNYVNDEDVPV